MEPENIPEKAPQVWIAEGLRATPAPRLPVPGSHPGGKFAGAPCAFVRTGTEAGGSPKDFGGLSNPGAAGALGGDAAGSGC